MLQRSSGLLSSVTGHSPIQRFDSTSPTQANTCTIGVPFGAHSSAWLERIPDKDEVPGSNPGGPTDETPCAARGLAYWAGMAITSESSRVHTAYTSAVAKVPSRCGPERVSATLLTGLRCLLAGVEPIPTLGGTAGRSTSDADSVGRTRVDEFTEASRGGEVTGPTPQFALQGENRRPPNLRSGLATRNGHTRLYFELRHRLRPTTDAAVRAQDPFNYTRTCNKLRPVYRYTAEAM